MMWLLLVGGWVLLCVGLVVTVARTLHASPTGRTLEEDLCSIERVFGGPVPVCAFGVDDVMAHYEATTDRDYRWLEKVIGPGMHTPLTLPTRGPGDAQVALILHEIRDARARSVLEVGCGRGFCTVALARAAPDVRFVGVDLVARHVCVARNAARDAGLRNATFRTIDATNLRVPEAFDVVFGCESLCHIGADTFFRTVGALVRPGGSVVMVDGFRSAQFPFCDRERRTAMRLVETGFRLNALHSMDRWIHRGARAGFRLLRRRDLTQEALPFWTFAWRIARLALCFPALLRWYMDSAPRRRATGANLMASCMVAHTLKDENTAAYGLLVMRKRCSP